MNSATQIALKMLICIATVGAFLYAYIEKNNELTKLRLALPELTKEVKALQEENSYLHFEINRFKNPANLITFMRQPQFAHLKPLSNSETRILPSAPPLPLFQSDPFTFKENL